MIVKNSKKIDRYRIFTEIDNRGRTIVIVYLDSNILKLFKLTNERKKIIADFDKCFSGIRRFHIGKAL